MLELLDIGQPEQRSLLWLEGPENLRHVVAKIQWGVGCRLLADEGLPVPALLAIRPPPVVHQQTAGDLVQIRFLLLGFEIVWRDP